MKEKSGVSTDVFSGADEDVDMENVVSLGDAADEALDGYGGEATPLIPSYRLKFQGMGFDGIEEVPTMDAKLTFQVSVTVTELSKKRRKDGELVDIVGVQVEEVKQITQ